MKPLMSPSTFRRASGPASVSGAQSLPEDFIEIRDCLAHGLERQLGYFGNARFVAFRYEPRAEDVIWTDERTFGIGTGAWQVFMDEIQPLADLYGVNVGSAGRPAEHVLLIDRVRLTPYFAPRQSADAFLKRRECILA